MVPKNLGYLLVILGLITFVFTACGQSEAKWSGTISEEKGITVVRNPQEPLYKEDIFSWEQELLIGGLDEDGEPLFVSIGVLEVDTAGNIYVPDQRALQVIIFDKDGRFLKRFGREGQGPGEFQSLHNIILTPENTLMILDRRSLRLSFYSLEGELLKELSLSEIPRIFRIYPDGLGNYWARLNLRGDKSIYQIKKLDAALEELCHVAEFDYPRRRDVIEFFRPNMVFSQMPGGRIVWSNSNRYELHVVDSSGKLTKKIVKAYTSIPITEEAKTEITQEFFRGLPSSREIIFPKNYPPLRNIFCDEAGRLFVSTYENPMDDQNVIYDIFDPEGRYIAKMELDFAPRFWKNGKLYTIEEDDEGFQVVKRYAVNWFR